MVWVVNATPRPLYHREGEPARTYCVGAWESTRAGLEGRGKSRAHQDWIPVESRSSD
jgi:hypothetical protein